jgi:phage shock protein A
MLSKRIANVWYAVVGQAVSEIEVDNAEALLDLEREQLHKKLAQYDRGLAGHAAVCERLRGERSRLERERKQLEPRVQASLAAGDRNGAAQKALRLEQLTQTQEVTEQQLHEAESMYRELLHAREVALRGARDRLEQLRSSIGAMRAQQALAELSELSAGMHGSLGMSELDVERLRLKVEDRRHAASARVRVARDVRDASELDSREAEQQGLAEAALLAYEARARVAQAGGEPQNNP